MVYITNAVWKFNALTVYWLIPTLYVADAARTYCGLSTGQIASCMSLSELYFWSLHEWQKPNGTIVLTNTKSSHSLCTHMWVICSQRMRANLTAVLIEALTELLYSAGYIARIGPMTYYNYTQVILLW